PSLGDKRHVAGGSSLSLVTCNLQLAGSDAAVLFDLPVDRAADGDGGEGDQTGQQRLQVAVGDPFAAEVGQADAGVGEERGETEDGRRFRAERDREGDDRREVEDVEV